jgi:integrase/recombinase XerD
MGEMRAREDISIKAFKEYLLGVKSKTTARKYASYTKAFLKVMRSNGYTSFSEMPPGLLSEFASMLTRDNKSSSTVRVHVYAVKKYLGWVQSKGLNVPIQAKVDLPKRKLRMREVLPQEQFTNYFRSADLELEEPMRTAVMLLPCCGLRASEMVSLRLENIHRARVKLKNGKYKTTLFLQVRGKGDKERHVPLMEEGVEILTGYLAGWRRRQKGPWLFPKRTKRLSTNGVRHISDRYIRGSLQKMREPLGMDFTPHTMRRTYITTLYRKGVDLATISRIAGHANVQTTLDHYIAMEPSDAIRALHDAGSSLTE